MKLLAKVILFLFSAKFAFAADCMQMQVSQYEQAAMKNKNPYDPTLPTTDCSDNLNIIEQTCKRAEMAKDSATQQLINANQQKVGSQQMGDYLGASDSAANNAMDYSMQCSNQGMQASQSCRDSQGKTLLTQLQSACMQNAQSAKAAADNLNQARNANNQLQNSGSSASSTSPPPQQQQQSPANNSSTASQRSSRSSRSSSSRSSLATRSSSSQSSVRIFVASSSSSISSVMSSASSDIDADGNPRDAGQIYP